MVTPEDRVRLRLYNILDTIQDARKAFDGLTPELFAQKAIYRLAGERAVEIVSEASRHIPEEMKATAPETPWREIAGIGNILRHDYPKVAASKIWTVIIDDFAALEPVIRAMLTKLPAEDE